MMHRTARFAFWGPFSRWIRATSPRREPASTLAPWSVACVAALCAGCTLITDVDRSKIPAAEVVPPDPPPAQGDAGTPPGPAGDAGETPASDAGMTPDSGSAAELDAGGTPELDAASPAGDAG